jgi:hypothetical protein
LKRLFPHLQNHHYFRSRDLSLLIAKWESLYTPLMSSVLRQV